MQLSESEREGKCVSECDSADEEELEVVASMLLVVLPSSS